MSYGQFTLATARDAYRNFAGLFAISLLTALSLVPLVATAVVGTWIALLGGLWTTCLLGGIVVAAAFRFTTTAVERGVRIELVPAVIHAVRNPTTGLLLGAGTFCVAVAAAVIVAAVPAGIRPMTAGVAGFLLTLWYLLVAFAAPELGSGRELSAALRASADRLGCSPGSILQFLVLSIACTLAAGVTVITLLLLLPGVLALLAARVSIGADEEREDDRGD